MNRTELLAHAADVSAGPDDARLRQSLEWITHVSTSRPTGSRHLTTLPRSLRDGAPQNHREYRADRSSPGVRKSCRWRTGNGVEPASSRAHVTTCGGALASPKWGDSSFEIRAGTARWRSTGRRPRAGTLACAMPGPSRPRTAARSSGGPSVPSWWPWCQQCVTTRLSNSSASTSLRLPTGAVVRPAGMAGGYRPPGVTDDRAGRRPGTGNDLPPLRLRDGVPLCAVRGACPRVSRERRGRRRPGERAIRRPPRARPPVLPGRSGALSQRVGASTRRRGGRSTG